MHTLLPGGACGDFIMAQGCALDRAARRSAAPGGGQARRFGVQRIAEPFVPLECIGLVLDADRVHVVVPVAGVPGDVARRDELAMCPSLERTRIVSRGGVFRILEYFDRQIPAEVRGVDDDVAYLWPSSGRFAKS